MNIKTLKYTEKILEITGITGSLDDITPKESKSVMKKLKKLLKEIELLRRMGGVTLVVVEDKIITTYHNNSMNNKIKMNIKKVVY